MKYGYACSSPIDEDMELQLAALKRARCARIFQDVDFFRGASRPALSRCLRRVKKGDTLVVWKLENLLCGSLGDLTKILDSLRTKGVSFRSLTEPIAADIPTKCILWDALALFTALERSLASQRIHSAIEQSRRSGPMAPRPRLLKPWRVGMVLYRIVEGVEDVNAAALHLDVSPATLCRALAEAAQPRGETNNSTKNRACASKASA
jgi:DNA invertase Pin-like site-specific DNA recombinase